MVRLTPMDKRTEIIHQRVTMLVIKLIYFEQKEFGGTKGDALERLIVRGTISTEGKRLLIQEAKNDPFLSPIVGMVIEEYARAYVEGRQKPPKNKSN